MPYMGTPTIAPHVEYQAAPMQGITEALQDVLAGTTSKWGMEIGRIIDRSIGNRIRYEQKNAKGQRLDPVEPITDEIKADEGYTPGITLVRSGAMTNPGAWEITIASDTIVLTLRAEHHKKWDDIIDIAYRSGKNWDYAFDIGPREMVAIYEAISTYLTENLGPENFDPPETADIKLEDV